MVPIWEICAAPDTFFIPTERMRMITANVRRLENSHDHQHHQRNKVWNLEQSQ